MASLNFGNQQDMPIQYPYGATNNLIMNTPYNNYMGRNMATVTNNNFLKCRPVASKEQAKAAQIDLDGSLWVFTDIGNEKIYTKQINNDGTAKFKTYSLMADEDPYISPEFVTKEEFNKVVQSLMAAIQSATKPVESVSNNANTTPIANF